MSLEPKKERGKRLKQDKKFFGEIIAQNFPNTVKDLNLQIQEAH